MNKVRAEAYHFNLWKTGKGNLVACISKMYQLHDLLFIETFNTVAGFENKLIYAQIADEIMISLEDFRTRIYGKKAKEEYEPVAIVGQFISFKKDENEK